MLNRRTWMKKSAGLLLAAPAVVGAKPPGDRIRIGQIGTRHPHAAGKMDAIRTLADTYEVVGVVEPDAAQRKRVSGRRTWRDLPWLTEDALLNTPGLQAVAIETEVKQLVPTGTRALEAGLHIHLDKPGGESMKDFRRLLEVSKARKRTVQMGYMLRYNPAFELMFRAVREGWLGEVMEIDAMMGKMADAGLRKELGRYAGGGMFELAGHVIDAVVYLLGRPDRVEAFTKRTQDDGVADNQLAVLDYPKATATVRCNHRDPFGFPRRRFQVSGDEGGLEIMPMESGRVVLRLSKPRGGYRKGVQQIERKRPGGRYDGEFVDLAKVIREEKALAWTPEHDLAAHETILRAAGMKLDG
ncbi:MAG: Gfo/Idh/MocA family oxidoreductase [Verrucomicrobiota bacterium]